MATSTDVLSMRQDLMRSLRSEFNRQESRDKQVMALSTETINYLQKATIAATKGSKGPDSNSLAKLADEFQDYSDLDERYLRITDKWQKQSMQVWKDILEELKHSQGGGKSGGGLGLLGDLGIAAMIEGMKKLMGRLRGSIKGMEAEVETDIGDAESELKKTFEKIGKFGSSLEADLEAAESDLKKAFEKIGKFGSSLEDEFDNVLKQGASKVRSLGTAVENDIKKVVDPTKAPSGKPASAWENILNDARKIATKASIPALLHIAGAQQESQGVAALKAHQGNTTFNATRTVVGSAAKDAGTGRIIGAVAGRVLGAVAGAFIPGADVTGVSEVGLGAAGGAVGGAVGSTIGAGVGAIKGMLEAHKAAVSKAPAAAVQQAQAKFVAKIAQASTKPPSVSIHPALAKTVAATVVAGSSSLAPNASAATADASGSASANASNVDTMYVSNLVVQGTGSGQTANGMPITQAAYTFPSGIPDTSGSSYSSQPLVPTGSPDSSGWLSKLESVMARFTGGAIGGGSDSTGISMGTNIGANAGSTLQAIGNAAGGDQSTLNTLTQFAGVESSFNPNAGAGTSSAKGAFQITAPTAKGWIKKYGASLGITQQNYNPNDPVQQAKLVAAWIKDQSAKDVKAGIAPTSANLYSQYFTGGNKLIDSDPNAIAANVDPSAAAANRNVFYDANGQPKTVGEVNQFFSNRLSSQPSFATALASTNSSKYARSNATGQGSNNYAPSDTVAAGNATKAQPGVRQVSQPIGGGTTKATPNLDDLYMFHPDPGMRNANTYIPA
jgi:Sec-independent protein translocase protein TatA